MGAVAPRNFNVIDVFVQNTLSLLTRLVGNPQGTHESLRRPSAIESLCKESQQVQLKFMLFFAVYVTMASSSARQVFQKQSERNQRLFSRVFMDFRWLEFCTRSLRHLKNDDYQNGLAKDFTV